MGLKLYNSLSRKLEEFVPANPDVVGVYACGPTVYNYAHIGNGRMAVAFDMLVRVLRQQFPRVIHASNITDVDDKIMDAAKQSGEPISEITTRYTHIYNQDMRALGVMPPDIQPKATEHIPEMIALIERLIANGHGYEKDGNVLFHVPSYAAYGTLSGRSRDEQIAGARVDVAPYKKDPADFTLWKPSSDDQPGWDSPWGRGRPGWHIECSAMAEKHLGLPFDIHGGGADLKFPHHENEIAQSCCAHHDRDGQPRDPADFARYWIHNGFVTADAEKMSKSLGNTVLPHDMLAQGVKGEAMRWALLSAHYRSPLDWTAQRLQDAKKQLDEIYTLLRSANAQGIDTDMIDRSKIDDNVLAALNDDLNSPLAQTHLIHLRQAAAHGDIVALVKLIASARFMGFLNQSPAEWFADEDAKLAAVDAGWIDAQIKARAEAKKARDFARSDAIRDELLAKGIELQDTKDGTTWSLKS